ncbi:MAG: hypothetical protein CSA22_01895 [Deltaproteobacteria bacterium]|nr:MAG: hypothetical protein CSA22_01895 [Deltaproteobacteria bacterium]
MTPPLVLEDAVKTVTADQDKILSPVQTLAHVRKKLEAVGMDILSETRRIDSGRLDIPVFFSVCGTDAKQLTGTSKQMGKGASPEQAEASAVMELMERFSVYAFKTTPAHFTTATWEDVKKQAIPLDQIAASVNESTEETDQVAPFFSALPFNWTPATNLTRNQIVLVPFDWFFMINAFNGASAGNCREEALCQGICEVVERHVCARVAKERLTLPGIDLETVTDPVTKTLIEKFTRNGIRLYASDMTLDTGIPTVSVLAYDPATFPEKSELVWTAGTAPSPVKALNRALTEVAQLGGDFNSGTTYEASGLPKYTSLASADDIMNPAEIKSIDSLPDISDINIRVEVERLIDRLRKIGFEILTIETTHPELNIPAFYTLIPGTAFRERAEMSSMGLFTAKYMAENLPPVKAKQLLEQFETAMPGRYYTCFYQGMVELAMEDIPAAADAFREALGRSPSAQDMPSICSYLGMCLKDMEEYDKALEILNQGLSMDAERTDILNLIGFCHFKRDAFEKAIHAFEQVIALNPSSGIDYANMATNYRKLGQTQKAIAYYEKAVAIDPTLEFAWENLLKLKS